MNGLSIENYIAVSISTTPSSIAERNVANICILTKESANVPVADYVSYKNATSIANDWGSNSNVYKIANAIFSQSSNILSASGSVYVVPMLSSVSKPATNGSATCENMIYANFKKISDGSFKIKVDDGVETAITSLDFSNCNSLEDVANVINTKLSTLALNASCGASGTSLIFVSATTGSTSSISLSSDTTGTDISTTNYLNSSKAVIVNGKNAYTGAETLQDAINRIESIIYYGSLIPAFTDATDDDIKDAASTMQGLNHLLIIPKSNIALIAKSGLFYEIKQKALTKTRCLYHSTEPLEMAGAYCGYYQSINFNGSNTMLFLHLKELSGITPDETITDSLKLIADEIGVDFYGMCGGVGIVNCSGGNGWFDTIYGEIWLKIQLENAGFNCIRNCPTKLPQTEAGMTLLKSSYVNVLDTAVKCGLVAGGTWNLPFTFGDQSAFYSNIKSKGYYIYSSPVSSQSQSERQQRKATVCQIAIKLSGAIASSEVICYINE